MPELKFGRVKFFNGKPDKMYGFIVPDGGGDDVFFHFNNGKEPNPTGMYDWYDIDSAAPHEPKAGDRVAFEERRKSGKGPAAQYWTFEEAYKRIRVTEAQEVPAPSMPEVPASLASFWEMVDSPSELISSGRYLYHLQDIAELEAEPDPLDPINEQRLAMLKGQVAAFKAANPDEAERLEAQNKELAGA